MTTAAALEDIRRKAQEFERQRASQEASADLARSRLEELRAQMQTEFGVDTDEEARAKLAELEAALRTELETLSRQVEATQ